MWERDVTCHFCTLIENAFEILLCFQIHLFSHWVLFGGPGQFSHVLLLPKHGCFSELFLLLLNTSMIEISWSRFLICSSGILYIQMHVYEYRVLRVVSYWLHLHWYITFSLQALVYQPFLKVFRFDNLRLT